jgi:hypothetical protein
MCTSWGGLRWLMLTVLGLAGCHAAQPSIKPPLKEVYIMPPSDDPRFSSYPTYPKNTLDSGTFKPKDDGQQSQNKPAGGFGGSPGGRFGAGSGMY